MNQQNHKFISVLISVFIYLFFSLLSQSFSSDWCLLKDVGLLVFLLPVSFLQQHCNSQVLEVGGKWFKMRLRMSVLYLEGVNYKTFGSPEAQNKNFSLSIYISTLEHNMKTSAKFNKDVVCSQSRRGFEDSLFVCSNILLHIPKMLFQSHSLNSQKSFRVHLLVQFLQLLI